MYHAMNASYTGPAPWRFWIFNHFRLTLADSELRLIVWE